MEIGKDRIAMSTLDSIDLDLDSYMIKAEYIKNIISSDDCSIGKIALILKDFEKDKEHANEIKLIVLEKDSEREKAILQNDNKHLKELMSLEKENLKELMLKDMNVMDNYYKSKISVLTQR